MHTKELQDDSFLIRIWFVLEIRNRFGKRIKNESKTNQKHMFRIKNESKANHLMILVISNQFRIALDFWFVFDSFLIRFWFVFDSFLIRLWFVYDLFVIIKKEQSICNTTHYNSHTCFIHTCFSTVTRFRDFLKWPGERCVAQIFICLSAKQISDNICFLRTCFSTDFLKNCLKMHT